MEQQSLFDLYTPKNTDWRPDTPPSLDGISEIFMDFETNGLDWWDEDLPIGVALQVPDGRSWYLPWGHRGGGNLDEAVMKRWFEREVRGKRINNANTRFDGHMSREWGINLEEQGNTLSDVMHWAALLDDHRREFNLNKLGMDYLGYGKKELDTSNMEQYHAGDVQEYARWDVKLVADLKQKMWPLLDEQNLQEVRALEDRCIWPVMEMEKNLCYLDLHLLQEWIHDSEQERLRCLWRIHKETGMKVNPKSGDDIEHLFYKLGLGFRDLTPTGKPSFSDSFLKSIDHPAIKLLRRAKLLSDLRSKYLVAYSKWMTPDGRLRYSLNQLRSDDGGTISGRFSSSKKNIQQVFNAKRQAKKYGDDSYTIRKLFIPGKGKWLSADAMQIEYRILAHYADSPSILEEYRKNPRVSFHNIIHEIVSEFVDIPYNNLKDLNFAKIYGAGIGKCAVMMGVPERIVDHTDPEYGKDAATFVGIYDEKFPDAKRLLRGASRVAESRGYVFTILGRRARFKGKRMLHSALNRIIQGGAGDIMKTKLCELHEARKETGFVMRSTVHDEVNGDSPDEKCTQMVEEILNRQSFDLKVPILWEVKTGKNWAEAG